MSLSQGGASSDWPTELHAETIKRLLLQSGRSADNHGQPSCLPNVEIEIDTNMYL